MVAIFAIAIVATLLHNYYPSKYPALEEHKKTYKKLISERDADYETYLVQLVNDEISASKYAELFRQRKAKYKADNKEYLRIKKQLKADFSYIGYTSFKNFLFATGFNVSGLILALLYFREKIKSKDLKLKKNFYIIGSGALVLTWSYWVSWSFIDRVNSLGLYDFEQWHYYTITAGLPIIIAVSSFLLFKYYSTIESKLVGIYNNILTAYNHFIFTKTPNKIKPEDQEEYETEAIELLLETSDKVSK